MAYRRQFYKVKLFLILLTSLASGNAHSFWIFGGHDDITEEALRSTYGKLSNGHEVYFSDRAIDEIWYWNRATDTAEALNKPIYHFDDESFGKSSQRLLDGKNALISYLQKDKSKGENAWKHLGILLHTLQDFYAHSTWVEQGNATIDTRLGVQALTWLTPNAIGNVCDKPDADNVNYLSITASDITTGYFPQPDSCDFSEIVTLNKCAHGSLLYIPSVRGCAGLNKDYFGRKNFDKAKELAIDATIDYVNQIFNELEKANNDLAICKLVGVGVGKGNKTNRDECHVGAP